MLLRPQVWIQEYNLQIGHWTRVEIKAKSSYVGQIVNIESAPNIPDGPGRVVTATMFSEGKEVIELYVAGKEAPIEVTAPHLLYSETRESYVPAGTLEDGELLRTRDGVIAVERILHLGIMKEVFDIEVEGDHHYYVSDTEILSHNCSGKGRDHVTYIGFKDGKPYVGYASAPEGMFNDPAGIIRYRYSNNFTEFGGKPPTPLEGIHNGIDGKAKARGLEQATYQDLVKKHGKENVANKQNPVGQNNKRRDEYMEAMGVKYEHQ